MFKITEPDVDTTIGSFVRKAYDVVAEIAAERDGDANLYTYAYDIDSKTGADLDEMVRLFGFTRIAAQRATGMLVFGRTSPSATVIQIPAGTQVATETLIFKTSRVFTNTSSDPLYRNRFRRINDAIPVTGNFFVPYSLLPIDDASTTDSITINTVTYLENVHFWRVYDITSKGGAPRSVEGIEIRSSANGSPLVNPPNNARFPVTYVYNAVPRAIEQAIQNWRLVGSDVWVHTGKLVRLRLYMAIVLNYGFTLQQVQTDMEAALSNFIDSIGFRSSVQASDLLQVAHGVSGVDAVRFLTDSDDGVHYAIQRVASDGTIINTYSTGVTPKRAIDVFVGDSETPVLDQLVVDVRASNTFGSV
jgi:hypothetical protein